MAARRPSKRIIDLAHKIRKDVLSWLPPEDAETRKNMSQLCGLASYVLYKSLKKLGYEKAELVCYADVHVWVQLDGYVIDVTATQFDGNLPDVVVLKIEDYLDANYFMSPIRVEWSRPEAHDHRSMLWCGRKVINEINSWESWHNIKGNRRKIDGFIRKLNQWDKQQGVRLGQKGTKRNNQ